LVKPVFDPICYLY